MTKDEFQHCLESALQTYYKADDRVRHYKNVRAVVITWEADRDEGLRIASRSDSLADVLKQSYKYDVRQCILSSVNPAGSLLDTLKVVFNSLDEDNLVIIHYVGHGFDRKSESGTEKELWIASTGYETPVNFTMMRRGFIDQAAPDVLMLLDCCHSGLSAVGANKEIIAAGVSEALVYNDSAISQRESMTTGLIQQLQHAAASKQILTSPQLYARLATKALRQDGPAFRTMPLHLQNYEQARAPIYLAPLFTTNEWVGARNMFISVQPVTVVLHAHLKDVNCETFRELKEWMTRSRPLCMDRVQVTDFIQSSSAVLIFEVTLKVWDRLPAHAAIIFIGFQHRPIVDLPKEQQRSTFVERRRSPVGFAKYAGSSSTSPFRQVKENIPLSGKAPAKEKE